MKGKDRKVTVLFVLALLTPSAELLARAAGYGISIRGYELQAVAGTAAFCLLTRQVLAPPKEKVSRRTSVLAALLPLLTAAGMYIHVFKSRSVVVGACAAACTLCAAVLLGHSRRMLALKWISLTLTVLLMMPFGLVLFGISFLRETVVQRVPSPHQTCCAEVIDSDQGALGGDTFVDVKFVSEDVDLLVWKLEKKPLQVYSGPWGAFEGMQIFWESEQTLVINGHRYDIS